MISQTLICIFFSFYPRLYCYLHNYSVHQIPRLNYLYKLVPA